MSTTVFFCGRCAHCFFRVPLRMSVATWRRDTQEEIVLDAVVVFFLLSLPLFCPGVVPIRTKEGRPFAPCLTSLGPAGALFSLVCWSHTHTHTRAIAKTPHCTFEPAALQGIPAAPPPQHQDSHQAKRRDVPCVLMTHLSVRRQLR